MICPSCGSDRAYEAHNYDTGEDWWLCSECGDGAPMNIRAQMFQKLGEVLAGPHAIKKVH